jgi:hypothetical protein
MLLRELFVNPKKPLLEGGNEFKYADKSNVTKQNASTEEADAALYVLGTEIGIDLLARDQENKFKHKAGSIIYPHAETGDADAVLDPMDFLDIPEGTLPKDAQNMLRVFLAKKLQTAGYQELPKKAALKQPGKFYKISGDGLTACVNLPDSHEWFQVDLDIAEPNEGKFSVWSKRGEPNEPHIPKNARAKGAFRHILLSQIGSIIITPDYPQGLSWSFKNGLLDRATKKSITKDPDEVANILFNGTGSDLDNIDSILAKFKQSHGSHYNDVIAKVNAGLEGYKTDYRLKESRAKNSLLEAAPAIGRKYQHIEDLVFTNGSHGGSHAVERLQSMASRSGNVELKWDGSPVIYWGRDENGTFYMIPKNAWEYLKRGKTKLETGVSTAPKTPDEVQRFITGTGRVDPDKEATRKQYAREMSNLWPYLEQASPERGFVEGGLLFHPGAKPVINTKTGEYEFTPNITTFHIGQGSELGQRVAKAKVMVAVTGYYPELGSSEEGRMPDAESLSTPEVIVQGTTYTEHDDVELSGLINTESYISQNANLIDGFLAPKPGLSKPGDVLYKFYNQNLRIPGVKQKFHDWVTRNVSAGQSQKILADHAGLNAVLDAVEMLTHAKLELINSLSAGTHGGIRQTRPEGYVQAHSGAQFKYDLPGQFVKAIDQANWSPDKER